MTTATQIPLAPEDIAVRGPVRGRYDLFSNEEHDRYIVVVDGLMVSVIVDQERSDEIDGLDWEDKIAAIAADAKRRYSSAEVNAKRDALSEWINRDDSEEERLVAIQLAQIEHDAQAFFRKVRNLPTLTLRRVMEILQEEELV